MLEAEKIKKEAEEWLVLLWSGEVSEQEQANFQVWLASNNKHQLAWQQLAKLDSYLGSLPAELSLKTLKKPRNKLSRRSVIQLFLAVGLFSGLAYENNRHSLLKIYTADYRTATGELREINLADNTQITLNSASAINLSFNEKRRRITLLEGEVLIQTNSGNDPRPLWVETKHGQALALGTRYVVKVENEMTQVAVLQKEVRVSVKNLPSLVLNAGQKVIFNNNNIGEISPVLTNDFAWVDGRLVASQMPLSELVAMIQKYRSGYVFCDEKIANLTVTGVFSLQQTDNVLQTLSNILPIQIHYRTPYWVVLEPVPVD